MSGPERTDDPLDAFFAPRGVALVGASAAVHKVGGRRWRTAVDGGYAGPLHPVNPGRDELDGRPCAASLAALGGRVELAVVAVPDGDVPAVIDEAIEAGVRAVVLITGGFAERGAAGLAAQTLLIDRLRGAGIRLIGPNCAGIASTPALLNTVGWAVPPGEIGLVTQSGNLALEFSRLAEERGGGFSRYVSIGNAADVGVAELAGWLLRDTATRVLLLYVEGWRDGEARALADLAAAADKPVVLIKPGDTGLGRQAVLSHTGSLAGEAQLLDAACAASGMVRCEDAETAWEVARMAPRLRPLAGDGVVVVTDGGGHATLLCDELDRAGFRLARLPDPVRARLAERLPARCGLDNPIDFAGAVEGDPALLPAVLDILDRGGVRDAVCVTGHFGGYHTMAGDTVLPAEREAATALARLAAEAGFPLAVHTIYADRPLSPVGLMRDGGVAVGRRMRALVQALATARPRPRRPAPRPVPARPPATAALLDQAVGSGDGRWLPEPQARALLAALGLPVPPSAEVATPEAAVAAWRRFGGPVVLKAIAPALLHRSEHGGVAVGLADADAVAAAAVRLLAVGRAAGAAAPTLLVAAHVADGQELILGAHRDAQYGTVLTAGAGGVFAEAAGDVAHGFPPLDRPAARALLEGLKVAAVLRGSRGRPARDIDAAADLLVMLGDVMAAMPEIVAIDLNPVFALTIGAAIADVRVILGPVRAAPGEGSMP